MNESEPKQFTINGITDQRDPHNTQVLADLIGNTGLITATHFVTLQEGGNDRLHPGPAISQEERLSRLLQRADRSTMRNIMDRYELSSVSEAANLYQEALRIAVDTRQYVVNTALPRNFTDTYGLRNPLGFFGSPIDRARRYFSPDNDRIDQFEFYQQGILATIAADLHPKLNETAHRRILQIQDGLDTRLFTTSPLDTKLTRRERNMLHSNFTNEVVGLYTPGRYVPPELHIKTHNYQARYVEGIGYVMTQPRIKSPEASIVKAIDKANLADSDYIDVDRDIYDPMGIMFVAIGDDDTDESEDSARDELVERVISSLFDAHSAEKPLSVVPDNKNSSRSASNGLSWQRYQLYYPDQVDPLELIFFGEKSYLNYKFKVGNLDDPFETDRAHALYEVIRTQRAFPFFFPDDVYSGPNFENIDIEWSMEKKRIQTAEELFDARYSALNKEHNARDHFTKL